MKKIISGKVRDVYEVNDSQLAIVTTDRISAFDVILNSTIPGKGIALNTLSNFWFAFTEDIIPNHLIATQLHQMPSEFNQHPDLYAERTVLVKKLRMLPYEFVVRGYLFGNLWAAYQAGESFCGQRISGGYRLAEQLPVPVVTPAKKAAEGHDEYISMEQLADELGKDTAQKLCALSLALYNRCNQYAKERGILIADTKFEFGYDEQGILTLGDELFTPDSSRFWDAAAYQAGQSPKSYDKQFVRDWLIDHHLDGVKPAPALPDEVVAKTAEIYRQCVERLTR